MNWIDTIVALKVHNYRCDMLKKKCKSLIKECEMKLQQNDLREG